MPMEPAPDQGFKTLTLRLPVEVYTQIASLATEERRSLQNQLLVLLEQALERQPET
ncbi:MAG TPA: Arc family DNA-binding protein [Herpetosiphonaceae bacterium]|nr:Arc family DNA-binding protein [Herpetosiphonaceae bacterium]